MISLVASVPLKIISELLAAASIVIFPDEVDIVTAASPVDISSAALEAVVQPNAIPVLIQLSIYATLTTSACKKLLFVNRVITKEFPEFLSKEAEITIPDSIEFNE